MVTELGLRWAPPGTGPTGSSRPRARRRSRLVGLVLAVTCATCPFVRGANVDPDLAEYREIVTRYRSGEVAGPVRLIASWPTQRLLNTTHELWQLKESDRKRHGWDATTISAACVLHLEVLIRHQGEPLLETPHLRVVREHLARLRRLQGPSLLVADLHRGLAIYMQAQLRLEDLQLFFRDMGGTFASQGAFLLAEGTLHEVLASRRLEAARRAGLVPSAENSLDKAERLLRQALAGSPNLTEARLRLAHVVVQQGRGDEGVALLQPVLQDSADPDARYLACLFLGQAHTISGRPELAQKAFSAALAERACGLAASIALAHLAFRERRFDTARGILTGTLNRAGCTDPWAFYDFGQAIQLPGLITELRRAVRR